MQAGKLRKRIAIVSNKNNQETTYGQNKPDPVTVATVWGSIEPLSGRELMRAQEIVASVTHRVRIRYRSGIEPSMHVVCHDRTLGIEAVLNLEERNRELELLCVEGV